MPGPPVNARDFVIRLLVNSRPDAQLRNEQPSISELVSESTIDWVQVWHIVEKERVAPLLYHPARDASHIPAWWRERCRAAYHETGILNTLRLEELKTLLAGFRAAGLEVIVLKGAALIELVYGNPAVRPMVDLDLLVRRQDVEPAMSFLNSRHYRSSTNEVAPGSMLAYDNEVHFQKQGPAGWQIELHWNLFDSPYYQRHLSESEWWRTADEVSFDGELARSLSPEWMLIHLCGHLAFHHRGQGLLWWNDLAELIRKRGDRLDWEYVLAQAKRANIILPLQRIIPALSHTWRAPVPPDVIGRLQVIVPDAVEIELNQAFTGDHWSPGSRLLVDVKGMGSPRERAWFLLHNIFPSVAYMDARYGIGHPLTRPFYYVYRWYLGVSGIVRDLLRRGNNGSNPS